MVELKYLSNVVTLNQDIEKCKGCSMCIQVCPHAVFIMDNKKSRIIDRGACMECGACALNCPEGAITVRAGVGCAYAILKGSIKRTEPTCDCGDNSSS